jgi:hypothetical protein
VEQDLFSFTSLSGLLVAAATVHDHYAAASLPVYQNDKFIETVSFTQLEAFQVEWVKLMNEQKREHILVAACHSHMPDTTTSSLMQQNNTDKKKKVTKQKTKLFRVKSIISMHGAVSKNRNKLRFRVRWVGFTGKDDTWESWNNLKFNSVLHSFLIAKGLRHMIHKDFRK